MVPPLWQSFHGQVFGRLPSITLPVGQWALGCSTKLEASHFAEPSMSNFFGMSLPMLHFRPDLAFSSSNGEGKPDSTKLIKLHKFGGLHGYEPSRNSTIILAKVRQRRGTPALRTNR